MVRFHNQGPMKYLDSHCKKLAAYSDKYPGEMQCEIHWRNWKIQKHMNEFKQKLGEI